MSFVVLCPFVHKPSHDEMMATLAPELTAQALVIDNRTRNLGAAGSRNVGVAKLLEYQIDWLVDLSPALRCGPSGGVDFLEALERYPDAWVVQSSAPVNWHCIAWHRRAFEAVGLFDENFWPIYGEDGDMAYRIGLAMPDQAWQCVDVDAWVTMYGHSVKLAGIEVDHRRIWNYYERKWGGLSGHERYLTPFNSGQPLSWWPTPPDRRSILKWAHG